MYNLFNNVMYNPFNKDISEIEYGDLKKLVEKNVSEGWFIEYKDSFPKKSKKIANSIASFANSEGGWYIVGIKENKGESYPFEIAGFDLETNKKPNDKIANIIKDNIDPIPYFESKIVEIPENKVVFVVQVFEGQNPPYISNGSVYIRAGETSKLLAIDDRYQFDKLLNKKQYFRKKVNAFMDAPLFSNDFNQPYLNFHVYVNNPKGYLFDNFDSKELFDELKENFNSKVELISENFISADLIFNNVYASVNSYIFRYIDNNNPMHIGIMLELFKEGHLKLFFPFNIYDKVSLNGEYESLSVYDSFITDEYEDLKIIDLAESMSAFQIILAQYKRLLKKYNCDYELTIKYKFDNFNLITPFIDSEKYMNFIYENKLPINLKPQINIPNYGYWDLQCHEFDDFLFTLNIVNAMGVSMHLIDVISEGYANFIKIKAKK